MAAIVDAFWTLCNVCAWCGWAYALHKTLAFDGPNWTASWLLDFGLPDVVLACELYACVEVLRMVAGSLRGNVQMGVVLHFTRLVVYHGVLPKQ
eukprot:CAMPEP_0119295412 /NCGR_PEP_ID=MMETSP1329-20130426/49713_1 /TAXON_ID=114041 /ORGANISM="Genus nov. species nov., Strain RCC1024" /LENGTH=93 /DNA_ID=CAMNT_0007296325 /DNA_START=109 /DNA_END=387 /DNA_ORIENTATION=+